MKYIKKHKWRILSFIIPLFILTVFFIVIGCFSNKIILTSDMSSQYYPLLEYMKDLFDGVANFPYSFSKGLGGGMYGTFFYYLSSPFNWLVFFFKDVSVFLLVLVIVKLSLSGLTMNFFLSHKFKQNNAAIVLFSNAYVLMGYSINYYTNIMWLDAVILAPIILLGIERILDGKKDWLYIITLLVAIISNYYIGYMLCFFSLIYFGYNLLLKYDYRKDKKKMWRLSKHFVVVTGLVGFMCSFILLPVAIELLNVQRMTPFWDIPFMSLNFFDYFAPLYIGFGNLTNPLNFYGFNIYCGILMLLLVILYFSNSKIPIKEKRLTFIVFLILLLPITFNYLNYIWHMFSTTTFFGYRYSFLATLFTLYIAFKSYLNLEVNKKSLMVTYMIVLIFSSSLIYLTNVTPAYYVYLSWQKIVITLVLLLIYIVLLIKGKKKIALALVSVEIVANLFLIGSQSKMIDRESMNKSIEQYEQFEKYYSHKRFEEINSVGQNVSFIFNYKGISTFLSTNQKEAYNFITKINGEEGVSNYTPYKYINPVADMLLGLEYLVTTKEQFNIYEVIETVDNLSINKNPRALSLGYLVSASATEKIDDNLQGIFYQQSLLNLLSGREDVYFVEMMPIKKDESNCELTLDTNSPYIYIYKALGEEPPKFNNVEGFFVYSNGELGVMKNDFEVEKISFECDSKVTFYYLDEPILDKFYSQISQNEFLVDVNKGYYIRGNIDVSEKSVLMLTIPHDNGWSAKVNGKSVEVFKIADTFIGIELEPGQYIIELEYKILGLMPGVLVSVIALCGLAMYELKGRKWLLNK